MSTLEKTLKSMMGDKGFEALKKSIYRRDSDSVLGPLDMYLPMMVVPRTILSWLVQHIKPMKPGDTKDIKFPGNDKITISVQKSGRDSYRADFVEGGKIIHTFEKQALPQIGGHLLTVGEMYETLLEDDKPAKAIDPDSIAMPTTMVNMVTPPTGAEAVAQFKDMASKDDVKKLSSMLGKLVDAFVANQMFKDNIGDAVDKVKNKSEDLGKEAKNPSKIKKGGKLELDMTKAPPKKEILQKPYQSDAQRRWAHTATGTKALGGKGAVSHWDKESKGKKLPEKVAKLEPTGGAASPHMPKQPKGAAPVVKPSHNPEAAQRKQGQVTFRQKFGGKTKAPVQANYFQAKLANVVKSEFHVTEGQLYQPCVHCGVAEFTKSEDGSPTYSPCACFGVTLKSDSGKKITFVELKKNEGGYSLKFNKRADPEIVQTFLLTLRSKLQAK